MFNKRLLALATGAALLAGAQSGFAGTSNVTANYEITLSNSCVVAATGQVFPSQLAGTMTDLLGEPAGSVDVTCNLGVLYDWGINSGAHWGTYWPDGRHMNGPVGGNIPYYLMTGGSWIGDDGLQLMDAAYAVTTPWMWSYGQMFGLPSGTGAVQSYALTADVQLSAMGFPYAADTYTDTVTVTVAFP